ncbi:hypothetical protein [Hymenobacter nivis]|uniref:Uncharacterized protein n=1 Tax=Hymenobacter nivis TaxID=1850093 RepID=A0A2Z3GHF3_9BACT|nr:hypothetical protein [Hymenobacter nivis]AWM33369.1 hypothetical protein DDQ68_11590 [Hymenobacter nivis]
MVSSPAPGPVVFSESQGFLRSWWWLLVLLAILPVGIAAVASGPARWPPVALVGPVLLAVGLFAWLRLDTRLDAQGLTYRMRPLGWQRLAWTQIQSAHVRSYSPIGEYGGWGIRGLFAKNRALNVAGSHGLQLELADGRRLLLGTQRPEELRHALAQLGPLLAP